MTLGAEESMEDRITIKYSLDDGKEPDLEVVCGTHHFLVHGSVLSAQSDFFTKALATEMKEKHERKVVIQEKDPMTVQALMYFLYRGTFSYQSCNHPDYDPPMLINAKLYAIGEEYGIKPLKDMARINFTDLMTNHYSNDDDPGFCEAVHAIYELTPSEDRDLRDALVHLASQNMRDMKDRQGFQLALDQVVGFGGDIVKRLACTPAGPAL